MTTDTDATKHGAIYESKEQALSAKDKEAQDTKLVQLWLNAIGLASKEEENWRVRAGKTVEAYKDEKERTERRFNILFSNIETIVPAVYSSVPAPDVRRRYGDTDPVGRVVSQMLERAISYSVDMYDFDATMRAAVIDSELVGRAITRVRYVPYFAPGGYDQQPEPGEAGEAPETPAQESAEHTDGLNTQEPGESGEVVSYEEVTCEHVPWASFRRGPARSWGEVPWIAFELFLTREQVNALNEELGPKVQLDCEVEGFDKSKTDGPPPDVFMRAKVWEIWDKESKRVIFIADSYKQAPLLVQDDPLGLSDFFPIPRPLYAVEVPDSLVPIEPYRYYKDQAEELDRITRRITKLVQVLKWRGFYPGSADAAGPMTQLADADDGEMVPVSDMQNFVGSGNGKLADAFWLMPVEQLSNVLAGLYQQREQIMEIIRQITGIADIMRGETKASETLGAQRIKAQWGSLRIQQRQAAVARYARDLFRIKAELISEKFSPEMLQMMTGIQLPTAQQKMMLQRQVEMQKQAAQGQIIDQQGQQAPAPQIDPEVLEALKQPTLDEVMSVMRSDLMRTFRIDIESDSTVRGDLTRFQENMTNFLTGTAQYLSAVGPMVQGGVMPKDLAIKLFIPYTRQFKLGKEIEDTLEEFADLAEKQGKLPPPPSPEMQKAQMQQKQAEQDMAAQQQKHQMEMQALAQKTQADAASKQMDLQIKQAELQLQAQKLQLDERRMTMEMAMKERELAMREREMQLNAHMSEQKHAMGLQTMAAKTDADMTRFAMAKEAASQSAEA